MTIRVTHLIYGLALGGLEQMVVQLSARLQRRGIEPSILALEFDGPMRQIANDHGIPVEVLPEDGMSLGALLGIRKELEKRNAAIVTHRRPRYLLSSSWPRRERLSCSR